MRRNLSNCLKKVKVSTHFALASSQLEYAATAWSLFTQKLIKDIERVLRRSARFVLSAKKKTASVHAVSCQGHLTTGKIFSPILVIKELWAFKISCRRSFLFDPTILYYFISPKPIDFTFCTAGSRTFAMMVPSTPLDHTSY